MVKLLWQVPKIYNAKIIQCTTHPIDQMGT
jgi:hypothetical protein